MDKRNQKNCKSKVPTSDDNGESEMGMEVETYIHPLVDANRLKRTSDFETWFSRGGSLFFRA